MTHLPFILDRVSAALAVEPPQANQHHLMIVDIAWQCWDLDEQLDALVGDYADGVTAIEQPDLFARLLTERLRLEAELEQSLSASCCCTTRARGGKSADGDIVFRRSTPETIVDVCLEAFAAVGDPPAMSSADLVEGLRDLPGIAEGRWAYADLTQLRLAHLLAPYGVRPRNHRFSDGQRKAYQRTALVASLTDRS